MNKMKWGVALLMVIAMIAMMGCEPTTGGNAGERPVETADTLQSKVSGFTFTKDEQTYRMAADKIVNSDYTQNLYSFEGLDSNLAVYKGATGVTPAYLAFELASDATTAEITQGTTEQEVVNASSVWATARLDTDVQNLLNTFKGKSGKTEFMGGQPTDFSSDGRTVTFTVMGYVVKYEFAGLASDDINKAYYRLFDKGDAPMHLGEFCGWDISSGIKVYLGNGIEGVNQNFTDATDPTTADNVWYDPDPYTFTPGI